MRPNPKSRAVWKSLRNLPLGTTPPTEIQTSKIDMILNNASPVITPFKLVSMACLVQSVTMDRIMEPITMNECGSGIGNYGPSKVNNSPHQPVGNLSNRYKPGCNFFVAADFVLQFAKELA